ncbi:MAG: HNH endonuclease [Bacteroidales bacterium]|nr:HNH endonuclease [Lachnoclostridium sp.]MCM1383186.1 HNH endonuclease [Lachnoclostridium sp.]MCM1464588.1 HNH endonuclease [Bacteroidales bacterium]
MRPINKGEAPNVKFYHYQDAEPYLEERIGAYCSYCEFPIQHVPEVEHKEAKSKGGSKLAWTNLLLSCKYCNARKHDAVDAGEKDKYIWPDEDDTFHCFVYSGDIPQLNEDYLMTKESTVRERAKRLYEMIKLDNIPISPKDRDRRYAERSCARHCAEKCRTGWQKVKKSAEREEYFDVMLELAKAKGFFSVWMDVFQGDEEVRQGLISAFIGTRREYCEE